ncbi:DUF2283 domain-containing protein [Acidobacteria bacterium AH-259-L09]|nr:DUF2283 domain-containing protein [Acidobacteria bacterium AH-259-L09]
MHITYDTAADALYIKFQDGKFLRNKELEEGIVLDIGEGGILLGLEILEASSRFSTQDICKIAIEMPLHLTQAS